MRLLATCASALALLLTVSACTDDDDGSASPTVETTTTVATTTAPRTTTEEIPPGPTPEDVRLRVYERSYSECSTTSIAALAGKYRVPRQRRAVAIASGEAWTRQFGAGRDAIASGRDGCLEGLRQQANEKS